MAWRRSATLVVLATTIGGCNGDERTAQELQRKQAALEACEVASAEALLGMVKAREQHALCFSQLEDCRSHIDLMRPLSTPPKLDLTGMACLAYFNVAEKCLPKLPPPLRATLELVVDAHRKAAKDTSAAKLLDPSCDAAREVLASRKECAPPPCFCPDVTDPLCPCP